MFLGILQFFCIFNHVPFKRFRSLLAVKKVITLFLRSTWWVARSKRIYSVNSLYRGGSKLSFHRGLFLSSFTSTGLGKTRAFSKKPSPVGFFGLFRVFLGFFGFFRVFSGFFSFFSHTVHKMMFYSNNMFQYLWSEPLQP